MTVPVEAARRDLVAMHAAAIARVGGRECVAAALASSPIAGPIAAVAIGKAASPMMAGAVEALGTSVAAGLVITKHGHGEDPPAACIEVVESSHPVPDATCIDAGRRLLEFVAAVPADAKMLFMMSGGASSLVEVLPEGCSPADLARITEWMLAAGLDIGQMNRIRKRISTVKGGRLAARLGGRPTRVLMISDVPGDDPRVIGSGPLARHRPEDLDVGDLPLPDWLAAIAERAPPLPPGECFENVTGTLVATPADARAAAAACARERGYAVVEHPDLLTGDAVEVGARIGAGLGAQAPGIEIWAGETTVVLPPNPGRGGRSQALALAAAREIDGSDDRVLLAAGTDGTDGPGEDAGAVVDGGTILRGRDAGLDPDASIAAADSGTFLEASGDLLNTGPTGTNVMDLVIALRT